MSGSASTVEPAATLPPFGLHCALSEIATGAAGLDREPRFPGEAFARLGEAGLLTATVGSARGEEPVLPAWELVRAVAAADASVARILDGHLNAIERLEVAAEPELREAELAKLHGGERVLGVWGADPGPGEGTAARVVGGGEHGVLRGTKTYCSGAGGAGAALVMVGQDGGVAPLLVLIECDERVEVDRDWYRAAGMRASESHRVHFHDAPVVAVLGEPGELGRQPWFSRDAMRTAASWAGMVDAAADAAIEELAERRAGEPFSELEAGRIEAARAGADAWLTHASAAVDSGGDLEQLSLWMRVGIAGAARSVLESAAAACGSQPFVTGGRLDRARRDLETFLLQHRLDPMLAKLGRRRLGSG
jgi:alkylation response protein AidB-like acyl-CoA dehydrogenase